MWNYYAGICLRGYILLSLIVLLCTGFVYRVNSQRKADYPEKRNYHPAAVLLSPLWPLLLLVLVSLYVLRAMLYGLFLILFTVALVIIRKPFLVKLLLKAATKTGELFLNINTYLIKVFFPKPQPNNI